MAEKKTTERIIKMKELQFNDVFELSEVLKDLKPNFTTIEKKRMEKMSDAEVGMMAFSKTIGELKKSKKSINMMLGYLFNMSGEEFGKLGIREMTSIMRELKEAKSTGELGDFINALKELML